MKADRQSNEMMKLLLDPEMSDPSKRAGKRQLGEVEEERERLQIQLAALTDQTMDQADGRVKEIERALAEIRQILDSAEPEEMRTMIARYIGPLVLNADYTVTVKKGASEEVSSEAHRTGSVAGARYLPLHIRGAFWQRFTQAA